MSNDLRTIEMNFLLALTRWVSRGWLTLFHSIIQRSRMMGALSSSIGGFQGHLGTPLLAGKKRKRMEMGL